MKLYFAGNTGHGKAGKHRENLLKKAGCSRLFSLFWVREFYKNFEMWSKDLPKKVIDKQK